MKDSNRSSGIGILGVLEIIFIILKLVSVINWSWWLVLIPLWIDIGIFVVYLIVYFIAYKHSYNKKDKSEKIKW